MTCGIYLLGYDCTDKVYIGQSENIEARFMVHLRKMRQQIHSKKLNLAYSLYGEPTLEVLEECSSTQLNTREQYYIKLFDALDGGFNTSNAERSTIALRGENAPNAKYSNEQILDTAILLCDISNSYKEIMSITGVSHQTVGHVAKAINYSWLRDAYPEIYSCLVGSRRKRINGSKSAKARGIIYPQIISPEGVIYRVDNTHQFAKEHGLDQGNLGKLLRGQYKQHKGWKRVEPNV